MSGPETPQAPAFGPRTRAPRRLLPGRLSFIQLQRQVGHSAESTEEEMVGSRRGSKDGGGGGEGGAAALPAAAPEVIFVERCVRPPGRGQRGGEGGREGEMLCLASPSLRRSSPR